MANYQNLKAAISAAIRTNGNQEITGQVLQDVLNSIVSVIGANYTFAGVATPATNPGTPDQNVIYLAMEGGTYTNFNGTVLPAGISLLMWNGSWTSETVMYGDGGVFDISVYKSSGGTLATFADLSAALDGGNNIPASARKGGMSVKFVQSSDNKYIRYNLLTSSFSTNVDDWQKMDIDAVDSKIMYIPNTELIQVNSWYNIKYDIILRAGHKYYVKHLSGYQGNFFTGNGSDAVTLVTNQWVEFTPANTQKPITYSSAEPANMPRVIVADSDGVYNEIQLLDGKIDNTINRINSIASVFVSLGEVTGTSKRIITPQGLVVEGSYPTQYVSDVIDISEYHMLSLDITCPKASDNAAAFAFYDDTIDTSTGQGLVSVVQMPQIINDGLSVNIPRGATKVVIGYLVNSSVGWYGVKNLKGMRDTTLQELNSKIDTEIQNRQNADGSLEGKIDNNLVSTGLIPLTYYSINAKSYLDGNGVLQESQYSNRFITNPITPTPLILNISGNRFYPMVLFYDDNIDFETGAGFISGISFTGDINTDVEITQDMIPTNATKMVFNGIMQNYSQYFGIEAFGYEILNNNQLFQRLKGDADKTNVTIYLSPSGDDANDGLSPSKPKKTIQTVINAGYKNLVIADGIYKNQQIVINGIDGLNIVCNSSSTESNLFESHVRRSHAKFDNSIDVDFSNYTETVKRVALSVDENHSYYKVFISHELPIIYNGGGYYGQTPTYNAILWEMTSNILTCKKVVPVLTVSECENTAGTFTYDGTYLYVHPFDNSFEGKTYKRLNLDAKQILVDIRNSKNIYIQGVDIAFAPYIDLYTNTLAKTTFRDCIFSFTCYGATCEIVNSDIDFHSCIATHAANDGWGIAGFGNCSLYNCDAIHCYDDGVSHHDSTTGVIDGGTWSYNGKGGITPSYGSNVNVQNAVCHHNKYGCYYLASGDRITNAQVLLQNVLMYDNTTKDLKVGGYYVISHNCQYGTKEVDVSGTLDEYGNSVIQ